MSDDAQTYQGQCLCGAVTIEVYESTVLPMKDGLPKLKDFPTELGGSGETLAE